MTLYAVEYTESGARDLERLKKSVERKLYLRIVNVCDNLKTGKAPGVRKLEGEKDAHRVRVGDYRIIFSLDNELRVVVVERVATAAKCIAGKVELLH